MTVSRLKLNTCHHSFSEAMLSDLSMEKYHKISEDTMNSLLESLEVYVDLVSDKQCEVEYSSGVLTLSLGSKGTYVINKQPPNKQIWLSSPLSGPKRYDYLENNNSWTYTRDGKSLGTLLREELPSLLGTDLEIDIN
ncbi:hypothetical protein Clacol_003657 [Clathrus columnatus]|uniref:ferroxidase n=1 Tax=Clathrus columnatus TaxID=1419009 RepID=A0AAV5A568_9AGAM|nr:hypothetical protein Clacol_003657 [Clathrus columnatus]